MRKIIVATIALAAALTLGGCGDNTPEAAEPGRPPAQTAEVYVTPETPAPPVADFTQIGLEPEDAWPVSAYVSMARDLVAQGTIQRDHVTADRVAADLVSNYEIILSDTQAEILVAEILRMD